MAGFLNNLGQIAKNKATSLVQNPDALKNESLILASLALVISRIIIANVSAVNARGTAEGPYRYRESVRTTIREICGWTLGFMVLRKLQAWAVKPMLRKLLNITEKGGPKTYSIFEGFGRLLTRKDVKRFKPDLDQSVKITYHGNDFSEKLAESGMVKPLIQKIYGDSSDKSKEAFMRQLYKVGNIVISSIPTVALAGYGLERFTRDHSDKVVDYISGSLNKGAGKIQSGAKHVHSQVAQYNQALFTGIPGPHSFPQAVSTSLPAMNPFAKQNGGMPYPNPQALQVVSMAPPILPQGWQPSGVNPQPMASMSPQFASRQSVSRPILTARPNLFSV